MIHLLGRTPGASGDGLRRPDGALSRMALIVGLVIGVSCSSGSRAPTAPEPAAGPRLEIVGPSALVVNERALLTVRQRHESGVEVPVSPVRWTSSDDTVVRIEALDGGPAFRVTALRRGTVAVLFSADDLSVAVTLSVKARVQLDYAHPLAIGETVQLTTRFVDVEGEPIGEILPVQWASADPGVVTVGPTGLARGLRAGNVVVTATTPDGAASVPVTVADVITGLPARVRFAHAADDRASVTITSSQGAPVTLRYGESVEMPVVSGSFWADVRGQGFRPDVDQIERHWLIRAGQQLDVFATRWGITGWYRDLPSVSSDSGLVRFVQGSSNGAAAAVFIAPPGGAVASARLINCYFDPGDMTDYVRVPAGEFDVIAGSKGLFRSSRAGANALPGRAVTYVIVGDNPNRVQLLSFSDF